MDDRNKHPEVASNESTAFTADWFSGGMSASSRLVSTASQQCSTHAISSCTPLSGLIAMQAVHTSLIMVQAAPCSVGSNAKSTITSAHTTGSNIESTIGSASTAGYNNTAGPSSSKSTFLPGNCFSSPYQDDDDSVMRLRTSDGDGNDEKSGIVWECWIPSKQHMSADKTSTVDSSADHKKRKKVKNAEIYAADVDKDDDGRCMLSLIHI